jgi:protein TonB
VNFRTALFCIALVSVVQQTLVAETPWKAFAVSTPAPDYPALSTGQRFEGSGVFVLHIDPKTGTVGSVAIEKSTGQAALDNAALDALRRWKFKPGVPSVVKVPIAFSHRNH